LSDVAIYDGSPTISNGIALNDRKLQQFFPVQFRDNIAVGDLQPLLVIKLRRRFALLDDAGNPAHSGELEALRERALRVTAQLTSNKSAKPLIGKSS
jgi:hypothetical protein